MVRKQVPLPVIAVAPSGLGTSRVVTQGSQSLALGLTITAGTQLISKGRRNQQYIFSILTDSY
jgi:hypothetical protein